MPTALHIQAPDGTDFYRQLVTFPYGCHLEHGFGAVVVTEGEFRTYGDGRVEANLAYVPWSMGADLPPEVVDLI